MLKYIATQSVRASILPGISVVVLLLIAIGCSSGDDAEVKTETQPTATQETVPATATSAPAPTPEPLPTTTPTPKPVPTTAPAKQVKQPTPAPTAKPTTAPTAKPTSAPTPTRVPADPTVTPTPTIVPSPTATPPPTPTPTPVTTVFEVHGFTLKLDPDADFVASGLDVTGFTETKADESQGLLKLDYNGADVVFYWQPSTAGVEPQQSVDSAFGLLSSSKPSTSFIAISEGDLIVDGQAGRFGGFVSTAASGGGNGGGLIGAWNCMTTSTNFTLTVSGYDSTVIQIRFDRLVENFGCG